MQDLTYHKSVVNNYPINEWVKPTNKNSKDFDVFTDLFEFGLADRKIENHYAGKTHVGSTHYFKISKNFEVSL